MWIRSLAVVAALAMAGCSHGAPDPAGTAEMPLNPQGGPELSQDQAIALASWALKSPANTAGDPARAARAIAAEDWLAGQTTLYGNFQAYAPSGQPVWVALRGQARAAIGVAPHAPSQEVVNRLMATAEALSAGKTLRALTNLPALPGRESAFTELARNNFFLCGR
jgi:hypothetical protein